MSHSGSLSQAQRHHYANHGFVAPIDVLTDIEVREALEELQAVEQTHPDALSGSGRNNAHYVLPALDALTHHSAILDAVESLIGEDILVAGTTLFIKEPEHAGFISWHQDARYIGLEPHNWVTAWLALTDVNVENGCMYMWPGSHKGPLVDHEDTFGEDNLLTRGQTVPNVPEDETVPIILKPGQLSLHHPRVVHGSGPNQSGQRRIGFAIQSYIAADVEQVIGEIFVQQARGTDPFGHHTHRQRTTTRLSAESIEFRDLANSRLQDIFYAGATKKRDF